GGDRAVLLEPLAGGRGRYRGVALLKPGTPAADVERLDDAGVRGIRLHFHFAHLGAPMSYADMRNVIEAVSPYGWHIAMHLGGQGGREHYDFITSVDAAGGIDHIGPIDVAEGAH